MIKTFFIPTLSASLYSIFNFKGYKSFLLKVKSLKARHLKIYEKIYLQKKKENTGKLVLLRNFLHYSILYSIYLNVSNKQVHIHKTS